MLNAPVMSPGSTARPSLPWLARSPSHSATMSRRARTRYRPDRRRWWPRRQMPSRHRMPRSSTSPPGSATRSTTSTPTPRNGPSATEPPPAGARRSPMREQAPAFATLTAVLGAVAQSGSAPRSHRGGQGFKSPQLHQVTAGQLPQAAGVLSEPGAKSGAKCYAPGMAETRRRGYGEDAIYFDHAGDCHDGKHHKGCPGRWRGVISLGFGPDGKRRRKKVSAQTKTEVRDKLRALHAELDAGISAPHGYTLEKAVADWLGDGLPGRTAKTIETNHDALKPLLADLGSIRLADLTAHDVRSALTKMAARYSTPHLAKGS